ncbi:MAG TPA: PAS domain S-box protein [Sphingobacteriaceae bacterium]
MPENDSWGTFSKQRDHFNLIFEHTSVPGLIVDRDLTILRLNPAMAGLLGADFDVLSGRNVAEHLCERNEASWKNLQKAIWEEARPAFEFETCLNTGTGKPARMNVRAIRLAEDGEDLGYLVFEDRSYLAEKDDISGKGPPDPGQVIREQGERIKELSTRIHELEKFEMMVEHTHDALILIREDGSFAYLNKNAKAAWGYSDEEIGHLRFPDIDPLCTSESYSEIFRDAFEKSVVHLETTNRHKDGTIFPVEANFIAVVIDQVPYIMVVNRDISERKRSQEALAASEAKFRGGLEHFPVAIALLEGEDLVVSVAKAGILEIWGKEKEAVMGKAITDALPEMKGQPYPDFLRQVLRSGETYFGHESEVKLFRNNRLETGYFDFINYPFKDQKGVPDSVIVVANEITAQVTARRRIEASENRLQTIIETLAEGLGISDADGKLVYLNEMAKNILGIDIHELDKLQWVTLGPEEQPVPEAEHPLTQVRKSGIPVHDAEVMITGRNGKVKYLSINGAPLKDQEGRITGVVGTFTDITERKNIIRQKDEFISTVSHELKTPVTSLKAYSQVLHRSLQGLENEQSRSFLERMDKVIDRLQRLISDLLDVTRMESNKLVFKEENVRINILLTEIVSDLQLVSPGHHLLITRNSDLQVFIDKTRIIQVIVNLVTNAVKYSPDADRVEIQLYMEGSKVICSVQDFGIGIPPEHRERVFERFHQVGEHSRAGGFNLGLGLYISRAIIKKSGGDLWFESEEGKGTTFYFSLPCC